MATVDFIKKCIRERKVSWTYHVNMRLKKRFISRKIILQSVDSYEIIEEYPEDKYLPSYLIYAELEGEVFHILIAVDEQKDNVRIITSYKPGSDEWREDLKTRRKKK